MRSGIMGRRMLLSWVAVLAIVASACSSDENEPHSHEEQEDVHGTPEDDGTQEPDTTGEADADPVPDTDTAPGPDAVSDADDEVDADVSDAEPACDWEEKAAEAWNLQEAAVADVTTALDALDDAWRVELDATLGGTAGAATSSWVYLDLTTGTQVSLGDLEAQSSMAWHLAFKRTAIRVNGGQSGPRGVHVASWEAAWEDLTELPDVPRGTFVTDTFLDDDCELLTEGRGTPVTAFGTWFDYDFETHSASAPSGIVWLVYSMDTHATFRVKIESLENNGVYTLRGAPFAAGAR